MSGSDFSRMATYAAYDIRHDPPLGVIVLSRSNTRGRSSGCGGPPPGSQGRAASLGCQICGHLIGGRPPVLYSS